MKPVFVMLLVASALGGCAMPEPIPLVRDVGVKQPEGDSGGGVDASYSDAPSRDFTTLSPAGDGGGDGGKDGLKLDRLKSDGVRDGSVEGGGKKKDAWSIKPKG
jgi:hypothetical protein